MDNYIGITNEKGRTTLLAHNSLIIKEILLYFFKGRQQQFEPCVCGAPQDTPEITAKTIPLTKTAKLRRSQRSHGLKIRDEYDKAKEDFIATKNPGQRPQQTHPAHGTLRRMARMTETMTDTCVKIFYGDYSRNVEDPTTWMQNLNTRKVTNDWTDDKAINVFKSLLAEDRKAYRWWHKDLKTAEPNMDRMDWDTVQKEFKKRWPLLLEPEEDLESKREELEQMKLRDRDLSTKVHIPRPGALLPRCIHKPSNPPRQQNK